MENWQLLYIQPNHGKIELMYGSYSTNLIDGLGEEFGHSAVKDGVTVDGRYCLKLSCMKSWG